MSEILPPVIINNNPNLIIPALHEAGNYVGPIFQTGTQGPQGLAATISVGTVTTGAPGSLVIVNNRGTSSVAIFDFTIPRGNVGAQGPQGFTGDAATISIGTVTTGAAGSNVIITNAGDIHDAILNFTIPRGDQGIQGLKGDQGIQGIQGLKGDQGIQGLKGDQGIQGIQGLKGDQGIQGLKGDQGIQGLKGDTGLKGDKGDTGDQGIQGIQGLKGDTGLKGDQGIQGIQGLKGDKGDTGDQGLPGSGVAGNHDVGVIYLKNNATATTIPSINGRAVVAGTMQTGTLFNFEKDATTNSLKYTGEGGRFHVVASFNFYSGSNDTCGFYIGKNTVLASALDPNADRISESEVYAEARNQTKPASAAVQTVLDLNPGDRIFFIVQNKDSTASIKVEFLKFVAVTLTSEKGDVGPEGPPAPYVDPVRTTVTGNGSTSVYAISGASGLTNPSALIVAIDGALQEPSVDYTVSGGNITFTSPLANGSKAVVVSPLNTIQVGQVTPSDGSVTSAKIIGGVALSDPIINNSLALNAASYTYGAGAAAAHRTSLGLKNVFAVSDESKTPNNTNYIDDSELFLTLEAGTWLVKCNAFWSNADNTVGVRAQVSFGGTMDITKSPIIAHVGSSTDSNNITLASTSSRPVGALTSTMPRVLIAATAVRNGIVQVEHTVSVSVAGIYRLQWGQGTASSTIAAIRKAGSFITATKLS